MTDFSAVSFPFGPLEEVAQLIPFFDIFIIAVLGLVLGSFCSVIVSRETIIENPDELKPPRSVCPCCGHRLAVMDLIPLVSFVGLKGRCRYCKALISKLYPALELLSALGCVGAYLMLEPSWSLLCVLALVPVLLGLFFIDLKLMILPNRLILAMVLLGIAYHALNFIESGYGAEWKYMLFEYSLGAIIYSAIIWIIGAVMGALLKKEALGFGDVKFFFAAGLWLGLSNLPLFMILSGVLGMIIYLFQYFIKKESTKGGLFPFGPALVASLYFILVFQDYTFF